VQFLENAGIICCGALAPFLTVLKRLFRSSLFSWLFEQQFIFFVRPTANVGLLW